MLFTTNICLAAWSYLLIFKLLNCIRLFLSHIFGITECPCVLLTDLSMEMANCFQCIPSHRFLAHETC